MEFAAVRSEDIDSSLARELAVLLGRAYTDERHIASFSLEERNLWASDIARVHSSPPAAGELMPGEYLKRFPTVRNLAKPPGERRHAIHLIARADGYVRSHVSLWSQFFVLDELELIGGYIEDVATDPLDLRKGLAHEGMRTAAEFARELELEVLGLATGLAGFYETLGWLLWDGSHTFHVAGRGAGHSDTPFMFLPLSARGELLGARAGALQSWRIARFGEAPGPPDRRP